MSSASEAILAAYRVLGLEPDSDYASVKSAFRARVKAVHPDHVEPTAETLSRLQILLKAHEILKVCAPRQIDLVITPDEARVGGLRTIDLDGRSAMMRVPPVTKTGAMVVPIGEPSWRVRILVRDPMADCDAEEGPAERAAREEKARKLAEADARREAEESAGLLTTFYERFVKASPAARFARWVRRSAA
ncbi:MAG: J domain-containing protein [Caulobacterales bacterium]|uniref:J domain-containing protein n=1 Tax=Glycocaulis sp. TaxID=1969725 RepID=UPI003F9F3509